MKSIVRVMRWLFPGCILCGLLTSALAQVVYQVGGDGDDGSKVSGTLTLNQAASTQASFNINNTNKAKLNLKGMLTVTPAAPTTPVVVTGPTTQSSVTNPMPPSANGTVAGAAITVTNPSGLTIYPLDGVFVTSTHAGSLSPMSLFLAMANPNGGIFWDFGDAGSEANDMIGFNAAHYYTTPGQKTITLTVVPMVVSLQATAPFFSFSNGPSSIATATVNVAEENRPTVTITPSTALPLIASSNTRYIFQAAAGGTTWNYGSSGAINVSGAANVYVGMNGNPATLFCTDPTNTSIAINNNTSSAGITVQGLTFDADKTKFGNPNSNPCNIIVATIQGNGGMTLLNDTVLNMGNFIDNQLSGSNELVQDCKCPLSLGLVGYGVWNVDNDVTLIDDSFNGSQIQWTIRNAPSTTAAMLSDVEIFGCSDNISAVTTGKGSIRFMNGIDCCAYGNTIIAPAAEPASGNGIGPALEVDPSETATPIAQNIALVSNTIQNTGITLQPGGGSGKIGGVINSVAMVNNLDLMAVSGTQMLWANAVQGCPVSNVFFFNNTLAAQGTSSGGVSTTLIRLASPAATDVVIYGNREYCPGNTAPYFQDDNASLAGIEAIGDNLFPVSDFAQVNGNAMSAADFNAMPLNGGNTTPFGSVYQNVPMGATGQVTINGVRYGSSVAN
jgi:hypothetical protein